MEAVINNTKLIRRVNIFALLILAVCVCAVAFLCKNMWLHGLAKIRQLCEIEAVENCRLKLSP